MTNTKNASAVSGPVAAVATQIVSQIEDAPARGILPNISLHLAGESQLFHLDALPIERVNDLHTTAVVMVVAGISPQHAWRQPILRLFDTLIGIAAGIAAVWIARGLYSLIHLSESKVRTEKSQLKITKETLS